MAPDFERQFGLRESERRVLLPWEATIDAILAERTKDFDSSHDLGHHLRAIKFAENLLDHVGAGSQERLIVRAGTKLHDIYNVPKNHPLSPKETDVAADLAGYYLSRTDFPGNLIPRTQTAIRQCSFIKGERPETREAIIIYIADKMDQTGLFLYLRYLLTFHT